VSLFISSQVGVVLSSSIAMLCSRSRGREWGCSVI